jgi:hypothetical protein
MIETNSGEPRSGLNTEQNAPKEISSLPQEKKVSNVNDSSNPRRKRFILDCIEHPDGSLSCCNLIPLTEMRQSDSSANPQEDPITIPIDPQQEKASDDQCTSRKCKISFSIRKRMAQKVAVPTEVDKDKR